MYSSSASPRTSRPARSQLFRSHDQRSPRTAHPLSRSLSPPASPRSCPCLCTERRRNNHSASPRAQPHADATPRAPPNERVLPRQILQRLTVWPPTILAFTAGHDPGTPHNPPRPAAPHVSARSAGATVTQHHARAQPADASDATWSCTRSDTECSGVASKATWTVQPSARSIFFLPLAHPLRFSSNNFIASAVMQLQQL